MKKGSMTSQFLVFIAMLFIAMIILSMPFGKGVVANVIDFFGESNSKYLSEEFSLIATTVANAPGEMKAGIWIDATRNLHLDSQHVYIMTVSKPYLKADTIVDSTLVEGKGIFYVNKINNQLIVSLEGFE